MTTLKATKILKELKGDIMIGNIILPDIYQSWEVREALSRAITRLEEYWSKTPESVKLALLEANKEFHIIDDSDRYEAQKIIDREKHELTDC